jgi:hypothetical protein
VLVSKVMPNSGEVERPIGTRPAAKVLSISGSLACGTKPAQSLLPLSCMRPAMAWPRSLMNTGTP